MEQNEVEVQETTEEVTEVQEEVEETENTEQQPSVQELLVRIAKLERERDKSASDAADWKRKYRATQSEKEVADAEKAEAQAAKDAEFENMKRQVQIYELTENYLKLDYPPELAKKAAIAEADNDKETRFEVQKQVNDLNAKKLLADFYKDRPPLSAGTGDNVVTKEKFDSMSLTEKTKLYREDRAQYERLKAM